MWNLRGELLPEPWEVTPFMKKSFETISGTEGPSKGTVRRYVTLRSNWDGDQWLELGLKDPSESIHEVSAEFYVGNGYYTQSTDLGGGHFMAARIDFPTGSTGRLSVSAPKEEWRTECEAMFKAGTRTDTTNPRFLPTLDPRSGSVSFRIPPELANRETAIRILSKSGNDFGHFLSDPKTGAVQTVMTPDRVREIAKVLLESRAMARFAFGSIPLQPDPKAVYQAPKLALPGLLRAKNGAVRLPDNSTLTLQAVTSGPGRPKAFWSPAGKPMAGFGLQAFAMVPPTYSRRWRPVMILMKRDAPLSFSSQSLYDETGMSLPTSGGHTIFKSDAAYEIRSFLVSPERQEASLYLSLAVGPERIRDQGKFGVGRFKKESVKGGYRINGPRGVFATESGEQTSVSLLAAGGKPIDGGYSYSINEDASALVVQIDPKLGAKIKGFAVKTRKLQWV
ncbi:hypothetical protein BH11ARM2_BH11ARM2_27980 [soil metagenome]